MKNNSGNYQRITPPRGRAKQLKTQLDRTVEIMLRWLETRRLLKLPENYELQGHPGYHLRITAVKEDPCDP